VRELDPALAARVGGIGDYEIRVSVWDRREDPTMPETW
jgi:hypothetical protein